MRPLLRVEDLRVAFGETRAVRGVSFEIRPDEVLAIVGESGSGKSATALGVMRLIEREGGRIAGGRMLWAGATGPVDLAALDDVAMRRVRGAEIAMIFQEPMTSLNPVLTVGDQIAETLILHRDMDRRAAAAEAARLLACVRVADAERRLGHYPHELSGGLRQRVMIAMALSCRPRLLIADEPTTALDVTTQREILALIAELRAETGMSVLFITHNLGVVAQYADQVAVMYAGRIVETAAVGPLFAAPQHPYTRGLLACLPGMAVRGATSRTRPRLTAISGQVCSPCEPPPGCAFAPRCPQHTDECDAAMPPLQGQGSDRNVRCIHIKHEELTPPRHSGLDPDSRGTPLPPGTRGNDGTSNESTLIERWHERQR